MKNLTTTTKTILFASLIAAMILPSSALASQTSTMTHDEELAMINGHVEELMAATTELADKTRDLENITLQEDINAVEKEISNLQKTIDEKTLILAEIQEDLYERYTIEPTLKAQLVDAKEDAKQMRDSGEIPFVGIGISHKDHALNLRIDESALTSETNEAYYRDLLQKEFGNIPMKVSFSTVEPEGCTSLTANCDPIVGGIEIEAVNHNPCSLSIPIERDNVEGYITAAHCVDTGAGTANDVYQPRENTGTKIGDTTVRVFTDDCDCAFVDHSGSEDASATKIWYSSNYYITVTGYTDRVGNGALVMFTGQTSGSQVAIVDENEDEVSYSGIDLDVVSTTRHVTDGGDSGGTWSSLAKSNYYGLHVAGDDGPDQSYFVPWEKVEDSNTGLDL